MSPSFSPANCGSAACRPGFLPLQSGVGNIANAVIGALGTNPDIPPFTMFTEVIQDSVLELVRTGKCRFASGTSLTLSAEKLAVFRDNIELFRPAWCSAPRKSPTARSWSGASASSRSTRRSRSTSSATSTAPTSWAAT
jgi:hypothetical protein